MNTKPQSIKAQQPQERNNKTRAHRRKNALGGVEQNKRECWTMAMITCFAGRQTDRQKETNELGLEAAAAG